MNTLAECEAPALAWAERHGPDRLLSWYCVLAARCAIWCRHMGRGDPDAEDLLRKLHRAVNMRRVAVEDERRKPCDAYEAFVAELDEQTANANRWRGVESYGLPRELVLPPMGWVPKLEDSP